MILHMDAILTLAAVQMLIAYAVIRSRRRTRQNNTKMRHALKMWIRTSDPESKFTRAEIRTI